MKIDVVTLANAKAGSLELADAVFGLPSRPDILHQDRKSTRLNSSH